MGVFSFIVLFLMECTEAQYKPLPILGLLWNSPVSLKSVKIGQFALTFDEKVCCY